jgi:hypothetical protein
MMQEWKKHYQTKLEALKKELEQASREKRLEELRNVVTLSAPIESQTEDLGGDVVVVPEGSGLEIILQVSPSSKGSSTARFDCQGCSL